MAPKKFLKLSDIECFRVSEKLSNQVWDIVLKWDYFAKDTVGKQFVRSTDSISANIAEGFGRYHKKDKIKFYRYSYASLLETGSWIQKAYHRKLLTESTYTELMQTMNELPKMINQLIKYTNNKLQE